MKENYSSAITSVILVFVAAYLAAFFLNINKSLIDIIIAIVLFVFLIGIILFQDRINQFFYFLRFKFRNIPTDFIYHKLKTTLEYLDKDGKRVTYNRENNIDKLSLRKSKRKTSFPVYVENGKILKEKTSSINSSYNFTSKRTLHYNIYFDGKQVIKKRHYSSFSTEFKNSFLKKTDRHWILKGHHYCKYYRFKLIFPKKVKLKDCKIYKKEILKSGNKNKKELSWVPSQETYTISSTNDKTILRIVIIGMDRNISYKIAWDF